MRSIITYGAFCLAVLASVGCKKDVQLTPAELIEGKWTISSQEILTTVVPGDGSYFQFNACASTCTGVDFKASDTTTGSFSYALNDAGTIITIVDNSSDGGGWDATWDVLELTETSFRITTTTLVGNLKVEMTK